MENSRPARRSLGGEEYISESVDFLPASGQKVFVHSRRSGEVRVLPHPLAAILRHADRFRTLEGHRDSLFQGQWQDDGTTYVLDSLSRLVQEGLLRSRSAVLRDTGVWGSDSCPPAVGAVAWTTKSRRGPLERSLRSFLEARGAGARPIELLVLDDSPEDRERAEIRRVLVSLQGDRESQVRMLYAGVNEKRRFLGELRGPLDHDGLPDGLLEFALFGMENTPAGDGANRNALQLSTIGQATVAADDDTVFAFHDSRNAEQELGVTALTDPTEIGYYPGRSLVLSMVHPQSMDSLAGHAKLLGRSVASCLRELSGESAVDLSGVSPTMACQLSSGECTVRLTMAGHYGDSGLGSPRWVLELQGPSRQRAVCSEDAYRTAVASREILRSVPRYTIGGGSIWMAANSGIDNRSLLPPFFPVGRNSDGILALTLRTCEPRSMIGYLPWAVYHDPPDARRFGPHDLFEARPRLAELIMMLTSSFERLSPDGELAGGLPSLGMFFQSVGSLTPDALKDYLGFQWTLLVSRYIAHLESLLSAYRATPVYWAADVEALIESLQATATGGAATAPRDLPAALSEEQSLRLLGRVLLAYGHLLEWWPLIRRTAEGLLNEGTRLAQPVV